MTSFIVVESLSFPICPHRCHFIMINWREVNAVVWLAVGVVVGLVGTSFIVIVIVIGIVGSYCYSLLGWMDNGVDCSFRVIV